MSKRIFLAGLIVILVLGGLGAVLLTQQDDEPEIFVIPPPKDYPVVTDLGADVEIGDKRFASLSYGVHTFLWWNSFTREWDLENVRQLNFAYVKQSFAWSNIQPQPEEWHWELADEVVNEVLYRRRHLVARIDAPPQWAIQAPDNWQTPPYDLDAFAAYCSALAERYQGQIEGYQVWNEPNLEREWSGYPPNPAAYTQLLAACSTAIRVADPDAIIISAGLSPTGHWDATAQRDDQFLWGMYAAGAAEYFDVLGLHAPGYALPPEASLEDAEAGGYANWARFRHVEEMRAIMVANGDAHKQIAILEMGWTTDNRPDSIYSWFGVSEEVQADYLARAYAYAAEHWRPWVGLMVTIYISDPVWTPDNEEWWWALTEPVDPPIVSRTRPAYYALANMEKISDNPDFSEPTRDPNEEYILEPLPPRH